LCLASGQNVIKLTPAPVGREGEGGRRGREGGRRAPLPPRCYKTYACTGWQRKIGGGREARKGGVHHHKLNVGMRVSLGMPVSLQAMVMLRRVAGSN